MFDKVAKMLARQFSVSQDEITMDTHLVDDLGADSLDFVELVNTLEEEYDLFINDEEVQGIFTVRQIIEFLESKV